ncbi:MAG: hypothetical protein QW715_05475, partial [Thermoplasmata archaeon]
GSTTYYLNVYQASGSVQWGYTSSPSSSSKNYVQDYWYSGSTLYNDNSYPNIYTIGYRTSTTTTNIELPNNVKVVSIINTFKNKVSDVPTFENFIIMNNSEIYFTIKIF